MIAAAEETGRMLMCAQVLRFFPEYVALRDAARGFGRGARGSFQRRCGEPGWGGWLKDPAKSGGGVFDLLIHDVDASLWLFGAPRALSATGYGNWVAGQLYYDGFAVGIEGGWQDSPAYPLRHGVSCDAGARDGGVSVRPDVRRWCSRRRSGCCPWQTADGYAAEIAYFVECCIAANGAERCPPEQSAQAVELMHALLDARARNGEKIRMFEPGVMFWAGRDDLSVIRGLGVRSGQLAIPGGMPFWTRVPPHSGPPIWRPPITLVTVFAAYEGEDYADIPTVQRTVGFIPRATRAERERRTLEVSDFAARLGVRSIACHVGFVPEDAANPDYVAVRDVVRRVCDHAAAHGQTFALETGQERAEVLEAFIRDVDRRQSADQLRPREPDPVRHGGTDRGAAAAGAVGGLGSLQGRRLAAARPFGRAGHGASLGKGSVGIERLCGRWGRSGSVARSNVERETENQPERLRDIAEAVRLLRGLV